MIDEKKLLEKLEELKFANEERGYDTAKDVTQEIINLVNEQPKTDWIPCEERLPNRNEVVLCWVVSTTIASGETYIIGSCDNGFWFFQTHTIGIHSFPVKDYKVVAWQPLPQPYQEDKP
jgi:hypothetical protein